MAYVLPSPIKVLPIILVLKDLLLGVEIAIWKIDLHIERYPNSLFLINAEIAISLNILNPTMKALYSKRQHNFDSL
jgi:hypothetical protein